MDWLRKYRIKSGLSQKEVASRADITIQFYNYVENGHRQPSPPVAQRIASALDFDWTLFFPLEDNKKPAKRKEA